MRRSKSNPAKYTRNYRSVSQRRMTAFDGVDEEKEMERLRNVLKEGESKLPLKDDEDSQCKRKRPVEDSTDLYGGILSKELMDDQEDGYNKDAENPLIVLSKRKKQKPAKKVVELTPQELRQAKQLQKKAAHKLNQLETRAAQKEKRKHLYEKLQETALSQQKMKLLSSSATLGKQFSKKEQLKKILLKERAGMKLTTEEHDLLYRKRDVQTEQAEINYERERQKMYVSRQVALPDEATTENSEAGAVTEVESKTRKKSKKTAVEIQSKEYDAKVDTFCSDPVVENANVATERKEGDLSESDQVDSKSSPSSFAALMMTSLSKLKTSSAANAEKALKERQEAELDEKRKEEENFRLRPTKRYVPENPAVLKTAASLGIQPEVARKPQSAAHKVREIQRPQDVSAMRYDLPVAAMEYEVMDTIRNNDVTIICAETGSGKSTQVPQFLYESGLSQSSQETTGNEQCLIGVTQPRRVAAVSTAKRVCYEMGHGNGQSILNGKKGEGNLVAYQTRYETSGLGTKTHIKFMTDGILLQEIQSDLLLRKYNVIVLDEAHERGLNTDVLIGLLSVALPLRKEAAAEEGSRLPPLKLVIMSATLRVEDFTGNKALFPSTTPAIVKVPGRTHPVTIHYSKVTELDNYGK
jgi:ATP-dependent RNA helicase DHX37/DHR1